MVDSVLQPSNNKRFIEKRGEWTLTNFVVSFVRDKKRVVESLVDLIQIHVIFYSSLEF